jgi:hypothetical protein
MQTCNRPPRPGALTSAIPCRSSPHSASLMSPDLHQGVDALPRAVLAGYPLRAQTWHSIPMNLRPVLTHALVLLPMQMSSTSVDQRKVVTVSKTMSSILVMTLCLVARHKANIGGASLAKWSAWLVQCRQPLHGVSGSQRQSRTAGAPDGAAHGSHPISTSFTRISTCAGSRGIPALSSARTGFYF